MLQCWLSLKIGYHLKLVITKAYNCRMEGDRISARNGDLIASACHMHLVIISYSVHATSYMGLRTGQAMSLLSEGITSRPKQKQASAILDVSASFADICQQKPESVSKAERRRGCAECVGSPIKPQGNN